LLQPRSSRVNGTILAAACWDFIVNVKYLYSFNTTTWYVKLKRFSRSMDAKHEACPGVTKRGVATGKHSQQGPGS
jgi:hypothetical protein